jgi:hypothetical protein
MIIVFLTLVVIGLIITNLIIDNKQEHNPKTNSNPKIISNSKIITINQNNEDFFELKGKLIATNQKLKLISERLNTTEKVIAQVLEKDQIISLQTNEIDVEKLDFRIKVIENEIENIKNPKPKIKTFYGKENDEMEEKIRSLVFNKKR